MRLIALVFSLYILVLTALPCTEMPEKDCSASAPISQGSTCQNDFDHCSPFCTCNCCATAMSCQIQMVDFQVSAIVQKHETTYPTLTVIQRSGDIWQPPQLS